MTGAKDSCKPPLAIKIEHQYIYIYKTRRKNSSHVKNFHPGNYTSGFHDTRGHTGPVVLLIKSLVGWDDSR